MHKPTFVLSATSGGSSSETTQTTEPEGGGGDEEADGFNAKPEKRRKHRAEMKQNAVFKLDRLVDVAARLQNVKVMD